MASRGGLALLAAGLALGPAACRERAAEPFRVEANLQPRPVRIGNVQVSLRITDQGSRPVDDVKVEIEGDMSHAGMAPVFGTVRRLGSGHYLGSMRLTMAGDWVILIHGRLPDGTKLEHSIPVPGVRE